MGNTILIIVLVLLVLLALAGVAIAMRNTFARQRNTVEESWRQIDVELKRRHDVIGNLVEVVRSSARFEQNTLSQVLQARSQAMASRGAGPGTQGPAERQLGGALSQFFAVAESYPQLQSNQDFRYLQQQIVECEDRIAAGRRFYNGNVRTYNTRFDTFPSSMFAGRNTKAQYFEEDDPQVRALPSLRGAFDSLNQPPQLGAQQGYGQPGQQLGQQPQYQQQPQQYQQPQQSGQQPGQQPQYQQPGQQPGQQSQQFQQPQYQQQPNPQQQYQQPPYQQPHQPGWGQPPQQ